MLDIYIKSIGYYIPNGRKTNDEILTKFEEENVGKLNKEDLDYAVYGSKRKLEFLGIETRACCKPEDGDNAVNMAVKASKSAIEKSGLSIEEIDCIIFAATSNPFREPSFAIVLADKLGLNNGDFFDINDTCNGFVKSFEIASLYIKSGKYKNILLATSESPYEISDKVSPIYEVEDLKEVDNVISYLFVGTGAAAMVLSGEGDSKRIVNYANKRESKDWDATLYLVPFTNVPENRFGKKDKGIWADGRSISSAVIKELPDFVREKLVEWNLQLENIDLFFTHQLGDNITFATLDRLNVGHEKAPINTFREFGNMACANIPVTLAIAEERGLLKKGDSILLLSSACGISYSVTYVEW